MRGTGTTTNQMLGAPAGSVYVWCNDHLDYPKRLAKKNNRTDLRIVPVSWLDRDHNWRGLDLEGVIVDHAVLVNGKREQNLYNLMTRVKR
jgi:hypothetical protein